MERKGKSWDLIAKAPTKSIRFHMIIIQREVSDLSRSSG